MPCSAGPSPTWTWRCRPARWRWPSAWRRPSAPPPSCSTPSVAPPGWPGPGLQLDFNDFRAPDLAGDLAARDFTVNALGGARWPPLLAAGRAGIVDPTGGRADLRARRLRPAGPGVLADDPLRALRAVRLEATLGLTLTPAACARRSGRGARRWPACRAERVRDEMVALLALPATGRALPPRRPPRRAGGGAARGRADAARAPAGAASLRRARALAARGGRLRSPARPARRARALRRGAGRARGRAAGRRARSRARAEAGRAAARRVQARDAAGRATVACTSTSTT